MVRPRRRLTRHLVVTLALVCVGTTISAAENSRPLKGQRLGDALRQLQAQGLRIVFSSEVVTADMRVTSEPRATKPRDVLDEILTPHGLEAEAGPGAVLEIVRAPTATRPASKNPQSAKPSRGPAKAAGEPVYSERVMVRAATADGRNRGVGSEMILTRLDLQDVGGVLADDPVRAVQSLPRVAASDDYRSEFSVRGSPYRHVGVVVDGVATPWLQHAAYGRRDAGSVAMVQTEVVEEATLQAGAYPQRYGDRLGAELGLTLRQGSRTGTHFGASLSGTTAALLGEGPLGASARGSWLVAARQSLLEWPVQRRHIVDGTAFGFTDVHAKVVYDARPGHQLSVSVLAGRSGIDGGDDQPPATLADGENRAGFVNLAWRASVSPRLVITQQAHLVAHQFQNTYESGQDATGGSNGEVSYRAHAVQTLFGGVLETGAQIQRQRSVRQLPVDDGMTSDRSLRFLPAYDRLSGTAWIRSGYLNFQWAPSPRLAITPGLRLAHSTAVPQRPISRWVLGQWSFRSNWVMNASTAVSHQLPEIDLVAGRAGSSDLGAERAAHAEIGIAHRMARSVRWQASIFVRNERDVLRLPTLAPPPDPHAGRGVDGRPANALMGSSRGVELVLERRAEAGISGWIAYAYGRSRYTDVQRGETFWGDFDQRHAVNVSARYALSERASVTGTFRGGTNFPIPGYLMETNGELVAGSERNAVRLPGYARLDLRVRRTFDYGRSRLTAFIEVLNVLNRQNVGVADGFVRADTGEAVGFTEPLLPRLLSAGLRIEF
jgi:hypothetical protein